MKGEKNRVALFLVADKIVEEVNEYGDAKKSVDDTKAAEGSIGVLRYLNIPSVLLEIGFITNTDNPFICLAPCLVDQIVNGIIKGESQ